MARIRRKQKRKLKFEVFSFCLCFIASLLWLGSSLFFGTVNTNLSIQIQNKTNEIEVLKNENKGLNIDIQTLQNKDRIYVMAKSAGLSQDQDNIVAINGE